MTNKDDDMRLGYYQLLVKPEHRWLTAFVTDFGTFSWTRMPFGSKCAANSFIQAVQQVLKPTQKFCDLYVDDLATFSSHWTAHLEHVRQFLTTMREAGLTLKLEKCDFHRPQVTFVGHIIGSGRHGVDPSKVACVESMKSPTTKKGSETAARFFHIFVLMLKILQVSQSLSLTLQKKVCPIRSCGQPHIKKPLKP